MLFWYCWRQRDHAGLRCQKLCCGSPHRGAHRSHRRQSAVTCSADREPPAWSWPSASQVSWQETTPTNQDLDVTRPWRMRTDRKTFANHHSDMCFRLRVCKRLKFIEGLWRHEAAQKLRKSHWMLSNSRQSLVKGERLVRHDMTAVLSNRMYLENWYVPSLWNDSTVYPPTGQGQAFWIFFWKGKAGPYFV